MSLLTIPPPPYHGSLQETDRRIRALAEAMIGMSRTIEHLRAEVQMLNRAVENMQGDHADRGILLMDDPGLRYLVCGACGRDWALPRRSGPYPSVCPGCKR